MNKFMNKAKEDNKGFSLVELIIVIAIMAILVGIIALQVIPYMEKSRVGKDQQTVDSVYNAFNNSLADESISDNVTLTIPGKDEAATIDPPELKTVLSSMCSALGAEDEKKLADATSLKMVSAKGKASAIICKYDMTTKEVTVFSAGDNTIVSSNKGTPTLQGAGGEPEGGKAEGDGDGK